MDPSPNNNDSAGQRNAKASKWLTCPCTDSGCEYKVTTRSTIIPHLLSGTHKYTEKDIKDLKSGYLHPGWWVSATRKSHERQQRMAAPPPVQPQPQPDLVAVVSADQEVRRLAAAALEQLQEPQHEANQQTLLNQATQTLAEREQEAAEALILLALQSPAPFNARHGPIRVAQVSAAINQGVSDALLSISQQVPAPVQALDDQVRLFVKLESLPRPPAEVEARILDRNGYARRWEVYKAFPRHAHQDARFQRLFPGHPAFMLMLNREAYNRQMEIYRATFRLALNNPHFHGLFPGHPAFPPTGIIRGQPQSPAPYCSPYPQPAQAHLRGEFMPQGQAPLARESGLHGLDQQQAQAPQQGEPQPQLNNPAVQHLLPLGGGPIRNNRSRRGPITGPAPPRRRLPDRPMTPQGEEAYQDDDEKDVEMADN